MPLLNTPDVGRIFGRGIAFPPRVGADGRIAWSTGMDNVRECIRIILLTEPGERIQLAEFGGKLRSYLFEPNTAATRRLIQEEITTSLELWEPRVALQGVTVDEDPEDNRAAIATIAYKVLASGTDEQISLRLQLGA